MRHRKAGKKLGRSNSHRKAMFKNQLRSLVEHERITTTHMKAKVMKRLADRLITLGKKQTLAARRQAHAILRDNALLHKLFDSLASRYETRQGGYTRIMKLRRRQGDGAEMSIIEFVDRELPQADQPTEAPAAEAPAE